MPSLKLNDSGTRFVLARHQLTPARRIGRGQFCAVYDDGPTTVIKLTTDSLQLESVRDYLIGNHFPTMTYNYGYVGEQLSDEMSLFMFKAERLNPMRMADLPTKRLARALTRSVDHCWSSKEALNGWNVKAALPQRLSARTKATLELLMDDQSLPVSMRNAFEDLFRMALDYHNIVLDWHGANLMVRGTDELIFNDVVVTGALLR